MEAQEQPHVLAPRPSRPRHFPRCFLALAVQGRRVSGRVGPELGLVPAAGPGSSKRLDLGVYWLNSILR